MLEAPLVSSSAHTSMCCKVPEHWALSSEQWAVSSEQWAVSIEQSGSGELKSWVQVSQVGRGGWLGASIAVQQVLIKPRKTAAVHWRVGEAD